MPIQAQQQIAQLQADMEGETQRAAAAETAQKILQEKVHTLEQVKTPSICTKIALVYSHGKTCIDAQSW